MRDRADHFAAVLHDDLRRIALQGAAESVVGGKEKPRVAAALNDLLRGADCKGVVSNTHCIV